jgi:hypothetical protein
MAIGYPWVLGPFNPRSDGVRIQLYLHKMSVSTAARQGGIFSLFLTDSGGGYNGCLRGILTKSVWKRFHPVCPVR